MPIEPFLILFQGGAGTTGEFLRAFGPVVLIFAIFYFLLIAPMRRRQKALEKMIENLKKGDRVITNGGIHGKVVAVDPQVLHLEVADKVRIRVSRSAISGLENSEGAGEATS